MPYIYMLRRIFLLYKCKHLCRKVHTVYMRLFKMLWIADYQDCLTLEYHRLSRNTRYINFYITHKAKRAFQAPIFMKFTNTGK